MESERMMSEDEIIYPLSTSKKAKSCIGVFYAKSLKAGSLRTFCAGFTRSLPKFPEKYIGEYEKAAEESRSLANLRLACIGRSLYADQERENFNGRAPQIESPLCKGFGIKVIAHNAAAFASAPGIQIQNTDGSFDVP